MRLIDGHMHLGPVCWELGCSPERAGELLLRRMDALGVDVSIVMPLSAKEVLPDGGKTGFYSTEECVRACSVDRSRLWPLCCVDPREPDPMGEMLQWTDHCVGFGEHKVGLSVDDARSMRLYEACGLLSWPIVIHLEHIGPWRYNLDEIGLPSLKAVVEQFANVNFVMHGPGWWAEISSTVAIDTIYAQGPISAAGAVFQLLGQPNVFADLSGRSAWRAARRDLRFTQRLFSEHSSKLIFGSDCIWPEHRECCVTYDWFRSFDLPEEARRVIAHENATRIFHKGEIKVKFLPSANAREV